jgi:O-antigen ligase
MVSSPSSFGGSTFFKVSFFVFIFSCVSLPSGSLFGVPLRILCSLIVLSAFAFDLVWRGVVSYRLTLIGISFLLFIAFYGTLGEVNGYPGYSVQGELLDVVSTFFPVFFGLYLCSDSRNIPSLIKVFVLSGAVHAAIKVSFFSLIYSGLLSFSDFLDVHNKIFDLVPITTVVGDFTRINVVNDFILPLLLVFLALHDGWSRWVRWLLFSLVLCALIISYSRYLWFFSISILAFAFFFRFWSLKTFLSMLVVVLMLSIFLFFNFEPVKEFFLERYLGEKAEYSDSFRRDMFPYLLGMIEESPWIGNGFGAYSEQYFRFEENPWLYELQWVSWVKDVGVLGFLITIYSIYYYLGFSSLKWRVFIWKNYFWVLGCALWFVVGFFNCFLLGPAAGGIVLFLWLLRVGYCAHKEERGKPMYSRPQGDFLRADSVS